MQTGSPFKLRLFGAMFAHEKIIFLAETEMHRLLTEFGFHIRGEWFDAPVDDTLRLMEKVSEKYGLGLLSLSQMADRYAQAKLSADPDDVVTICSYEGVLQRTALLLSAPNRKSREFCY